MSIKIKNLSELSKHAYFIKRQQPLVREVYSSSIYFFGGTNDCQYSISFEFGEEPKRSSKVEIALLSAINAACNTDFEIDDEEFEA